ncbi:MAG: TIGR03986 family CRISPR-associated RAMP protein [Chloroflexi bacterium]|nr:TIGR03986 family CRISPR-associated RAMP protein [Chloroflexota bacterium]
MKNNHRNPEYAERTARAPYNFVPLPEKVLTVRQPAAQNCYTGLSGYFDCRFETSSPTYVRGMLTVEQAAAGEESKNHPEHFTRPGNPAPVFPGSSLRGMFRTLVEVISYARPAWVTPDRLVYRAVGDITGHGLKYRSRIMLVHTDKKFTPRVKAGYMHQEDGKWFILPAREINGTTFSRINHRRIPDDLPGWYGCRNASRIFIQPGPYQFQDMLEGYVQIEFSKVLEASPISRENYIEAVLARSGKMNKKRSEAVIYPPDPQAAKLEVSLDIVQRYRDQVTESQIEILGDGQGVLREMQPVFYLVENNQLVFMGHTMMMRLPYQISPAEHVPGEPGREGEIDLAEALFGFTRPQAMKDALQALAGRVFFEDALCLPGQANFFEREITPQALSSPRPTTFQHYLEQPYPDDKSRLVDYDDGNAHLRGTKFYWHHNNRPIQQIEETNLDKLKHQKIYTRIRPVRAGVGFGFKIFFDNLTEIELGALAWVLQTGAAPAYRLKIGMGKPLGMGAIRFTQADLHLYDRKQRYQQLLAGPTAWQCGENDARADCETQQKAAISAFTSWVRDDGEINPGGKIPAFEQLQRIRFLLKLLSWPGPQEEWTRYMEIERPDKDAKKGKVNEYRNRPVLPDPDGVGQAPARSGQTPPAPRQPVQLQPPARPGGAGRPEKPRKQALPPIEVPAPQEEIDPFAKQFMSALEEDRPQPAARPQPGSPVITVIEEEDDDCLYLSLDEFSNNYVGILSKEELPQEQWKIGKTLTAWVQRIDDTQAGEIDVHVTLTPPGEQDRS